MPTVLIVGAYRFFFYSNEGREPAHIHVEANGNEAKFWLATGELAMSYGFKTALLDIVAEKRKMLMEAWNEYFPGTI